MFRWKPKLERFLMPKYFLPKYHGPPRISKNVTTPIGQDRLTEILSELKLSAVQIKDWVIVHRPWFDMSINSEPYVGLQLYLNTTSLRYIVRVWGRTHSKGRYLNDVHKAGTCPHILYRMEVHPPPCALLCVLFCYPIPTLMV